MKQNFKNREIILLFAQQKESSVLNIGTTTLNHLSLNASSLKDLLFMQLRLHLCFSFFHFFFFNLHFPLSFPSYQPDKLGKQLSDLVSAGPRICLSIFVGLLGVDLRALGESKLFLRICLMAEIKCTVGFGGGPEVLNFLQKFMCLAIASSVLISLPDLMISSLIASAHSPQIQWSR